MVRTCLFYVKSISHILVRFYIMKKYFAACKRHIKIYKTYDKHTRTKAFKELKAL